MAGFANTTNQLPLSGQSSWHDPSAHRHGALTSFRPVYPATMEGTGQMLDQMVVGPVRLSAPFCLADQDNPSPCLFKAEQESEFT